MSKSMAYDPSSLLIFLNLLSSTSCEDHYHHLHQHYHHHHHHRHHNCNDDSYHSNNSYRSSSLLLQSAQSLSCWGCCHCWSSPHPAPAILLFKIKSRQSKHCYCWSCTTFDSPRGRGWRRPRYHRSRSRLRFPFTLAPCLDWPEGPSRTTISHWAETKFHTGEGSFTHIVVFAYNNHFEHRFEWPGGNNVQEWVWAQGTQSTATKDLSNHFYDEQEAWASGTSSSRCLAIANPGTMTRAFSSSPSFASWCSPHSSSSSTSTSSTWSVGRILVFVVVFVLAIHQIEATLRCYVCGGHSGRSCETIREPRRRSPYVRPEPVAASDGSPQWEQCNDLISNQGCIKQVVNNGTFFSLLWLVLPLPPSLVGGVVWSHVLWTRVRPDPSLMFHPWVPFYESGWETTQSTQLCR